MEQQHPIPQQISSYQFRLVGDMTIKQFFQVAGGALVALLVYSSGLHPYIKWPLIIISFLFGIALAFFPLEDRPLSKWIFLFFKAIYSPTVYKWRGVEPKPEYFQAEGTSQPITAAPAIVSPPNVSPLTLSTPITPPAPPQESPLGQPETQSAIGRIIPTAPAPPTTPQTTTSQKNPVIVPVALPIQSMSQEKNASLPQEISASATPTGFGVSPSTGHISPGATPAQFTPEASPPTPPTKANVVVGQVTDGQGKIIENAILEIKDSDGRAARALRSNKLGHFMIVTPLLDGNYQIITEKDGFNFGPISFGAAGRIIPPILIIGKVIN